MSMLAASVLRLALGHWKGVLAGLGLAALGLLLMLAKAETRHWRKQAERHAELHQAEREAHARTVADYRRAAELTRAQDLAHAATVERAQVVITQEIASEYSSKIAALRTRYDALRLRSPAAAAGADPGAGGGAYLPRAGQAAGGAAAAAGEEGFSLEDRLICSSQAEQLDALIGWTERVQAVTEGSQAKATG